MAQEHNALKYNPQLARLGERGFGIDDNEQSITRMSETLQGVADLYSQQEWAIYRKEVWFARAAAISPAVAARNSAYELVNNTTASGPVICVVRSLKLLTNGVTVECAIAAGVAAVANSVLDQASSLDSRIPIAQVAQCNLFHGDLAAALAQPQWALVAVATAGGDETSSYPQWVIHPGFKLQVVMPTQNQAFRLAVCWSERPPFPGELAS